MPVPGGDGGGAIVIFTGDGCVPFVSAGMITLLFPVGTRPVISFPAWAPDIIVAVSLTGRGVEVMKVGRTKSVAERATRLKLEKRMPVVRISFFRV